MSRIVSHLAIQRENAFGGYNTRTLCGRENRAYYVDGINDTANSDEVTCKICKKMITEDRYPAGYSKALKD